MKNQLKVLRELQHWSQADLARELGVSRQAINGFESGKYDPSLEMAFRLAHLFKVSIETVFTYEEKRPMQTIIERLKKSFGFERFSQKAMNAMTFAHREAIRSQQQQISPEHILLGLLADPVTTASKLLRANGMTQQIVLDDHSFESAGSPKLNVASQSMMELTLEIAKRNGKKSIGTEHLLWALIQLAETRNSALLVSFQDYGIRLETLKIQLEDVI
jgi:putative transcriptional regulator